MNSITKIMLFALLMLIAFTALSATTNAQSPIPGNGRDEVDAALDRAIEFLVKSQRADGAISEGSHDTAMTSLAIMSLASMGVTPSQQDAKGEVMRKAIDFVLQDSKQDAKGYFGVADGSRMYGHGITTLMLTEIMGMGANEEQDQKIRAKCQKGIELILNAQQHPKQPSHRGGWRYTPDAGDSDLSVSVWQVMALRSAANDGLDVPESAIEDAVRYLRRSCTSPQDANGVPLQADAGFAYTPGSNSILYSMTAAGLLAMQVCGQYESKLVDRAADWLMKNPPKVDANYFYYGTYYYAQGMHQRGGEYSTTAAKAVKDILLPMQTPEGFWNGVGSEGGHGKIYATSMAVLSLSVKYHYLPIYQR